MSGSPSNTRVNQPDKSISKGTWKPSGDKNKQPQANMGQNAAMGMFGVQPMGMGMAQPMGMGMAQPMGMGMA